MARTLAERLAALQKSVGRTERNLPDADATPLTTPELPLPVPLHPLSRLGFVEEHGGFGSIFHRTLRYDLLTVHGRVRFADILSTSMAALSHLAGAELKPHQLRFYDTETTGLGTGAGTFPFLHAVGEIVGDEFLIHQYFLDEFAQEPAVLQTLATQHFSDETVIVSFNGKTFDWPLFNNRLVMYRMPPLQRPQLDLLHPSRRLWKQKLQRVSLGRLEEGVLGLLRCDDLPGKEAPARYFAYANEKDANLVEGVFDHNASDICSLVSLTVLLDRILAGEEPVDTSAELVALGKWREEWKDYDLAQKCYQAATDAVDADWRAHWQSSMFLKRQGNWTLAASVWEQMTRRYEWSLPPAVELAKYTEHRLKDYAAAAHWTQVAMERHRLQVRMSQGMATPWQSHQAHDEILDLLNHRLARITKKLNGVSA